MTPIERIASATGFRPFVDRLGFTRSAGRASGEELTIEDRRAMAGILTQD